MKNETTRCFSKWFTRITDLKCVSLIWRPKSHDLPFLHIPRLSLCSFIQQYFDTAKQTWKQNGHILELRRNVFELWKQMCEIICIYIYVTCITCIVDNLFKFPKGQSQIGHSLCTSRQFSAISSNFFEKKAIGQACRLWCAAGSGYLWWLWGSPATGHTHWDLTHTMIHFVHLGNSLIFL